MRAPGVTATIERRLLLNYRADPDVAATALPPRLRPHLVGGAAVVGVCVLQLSAVRPSGLPGVVGLRTKNAAHRIGVEWDTPSGVATGVYVPMRLTTSRLTTMLGGRMVPGLHQLARFDGNFRGGRHEVTIESRDGRLSIHAVATETDQLNSALFDDLAAASCWFRGATVAWSPDHSGQLEGMEMEVSPWHIRPLTIESMASSWFDDPVRFPSGSLKPDCGLLMEGLAVRSEAVPFPTFELGAFIHT